VGIFDHFVVILASRSFRDYLQNPQRYNVIFLPEDIAEPEFVTLLEPFHSEAKKTIRCDRWSFRS
jgi:hypothetical protein